MEILYLLIPVALLIVAGAVGAFIWAVNSGQFEDTDGPAVRVLMEDDRVEDESAEKNESARADHET